ncbi:hypothetical protein IEO21_10501 [Rhodonia placenta]|uniref:Uncharacterized protein n=1 Tax=Rhodonia placenta TaxID=104341 RepID=A0A8H7NSF2_9APHY|nr:hypothetical protein IEO21_10501 [Postia placenta]
MIHRPGSLACARRTLVGSVLMRRAVATVCIGLTGGA